MDGLILKVLEKLVHSLELPCYHLCTHRVSNCEKDFTFILLVLPYIFLINTILRKKKPADALLQYLQHFIKYVIQSFLEVRLEVKSLLFS